MVWTNQKPPSARRTTTRSVAGATLLAFLGAMTCSGCYTKVVGASGPAAEQYKIEQSDRSDTWLDRQVFGDEPAPRTK